MLSWIPLLGPILQGLFSTASTIYSKFKDTEVAKRVQDTADAQIGAQIVQSNMQYLSIRIMTDAALIMPVVWSALIGWDTIVAIRYPELKFNVADYPTNVQYIPYGAFAFLFGVLGMNIWKRG